MLSEPLVQKRVVRVDQMADRHVFADEISQIHLRFNGQVVIQQVVVLWVQLERR